MPELIDRTPEPTRTCVVHGVVWYKLDAEEGAKKRDEQERLEEAVGLSQAINLAVVHKQLFHIKKISPATLFGRGMIEELSSVIKATNTQLVVVDNALTPVQQRNLEKAWQCKVIDRTGLILEIFGERARTAEGRLQVELAALTYQRSRLVRSWTHLERQRGGFGFTGGPGESQLELDRRIIDDRIVKIKKELESVKKTRALHRVSRKKIPLPVVALVGYTNAGKSTLFNYLTKANVFAENLLFATLDPTMRQIKLPSGREIILSDTVGFISDLPTQLVAAFRATLEEVQAADLILHVRDIAHPDSEYQKLDVHKVLTELGVGAVIKNNQHLEVCNKIDLLSDMDLENLKNQCKRSSNVVAISAVSGDEIDTLLLKIDEFLGKKGAVRDLVLDASNGELLSWLYRHGAVVSRVDEEDKIKLTIRLEESEMKRLQDLMKKIM